MKFVDYADEHAERLRTALDSTDEAPLLRCETYLRHMYGRQGRGRLALLLDDTGRVLATLGSERVSLRIGSERVDAVVGTNTYSFERGALGFLLHDWMRSAPMGIMLPSNAVWDAMLARQSRWHCVTGLHTWILNWNYPVFADDPWWKRLAKPPARLLVRIDPAAFVGRVAAIDSSLAAEEIDDFTEDMVARNGPFGLRLDPDLGYLRWRFSPSLPHVHYRIFSLHAGTATVGYVVLADWPHCLVVAHCDGDDPVQLAHGVLLAIAVANRGGQRYRQVLLASMHPAMNGVFEQFGFRPKPSEMSFYVASFGKTTTPVERGRDWLVSLDLGDQAIALGLLDANSRLRTPTAATA